ncbi:ribonuclease H-like domain-containing protein [Tanacetum coccineum]
MMSSPNLSTSDIEDAFSSMNILNYTSVSSIIPQLSRKPDIQAFYAKELPISSPDPITSPAILTPSPILSPSLLFDPRYFFVPEELLPPKKRICSSSSSSTTLSNSSRNQTCNLVSPFSSVYTPTPPQIFGIGKYSDKMYLKHHEKQIEDILNYLDELSLYRIERMEEGRINGNELKTKLKKICTQIIKLQKKQLGQKDKITFAYYRISDLEQIIEKNPSSIPLKRASTSEAPAMTQAAIRKLVADSNSYSENGCHVMILNTLDHLGKFDAKGDEGFFVGYSLSSKAFRVYNKRTRHIEENLHIDFLENKVIDKGAGPDWLFDIESLTKSMNYVPVVVAGTSSTNIARTKEGVKEAVQEKESPFRFISLTNWFHEAQEATSTVAAKKPDAVLEINSPQKE